MSLDVNIMSLQAVYNYHG